MQFSEIKELATIHKGMPLDFPRRWANEGQIRLATLYDTACKAATTTVEATDPDTEYPLPQDNRGVTRVTDQNGKYRYYVATQTGISFRDSGTYTVTYLALPATILTDTSEVQLHALYGPVLAKFVASRELQYVRATDAQRLMAEFLTDGIEVDKKLSRMNRKSVYIPTQIWR